MKKITLFFTLLLYCLTSFSQTPVTRSQYLSDIDATIYTNGTHKITATADNALRKEQGYSNLFFSDSTVKYATPYMLSKNGWSVTGNSITPSTNFIGTTNNASFRMRTNNTQKAVLDSLGCFGIGGNLDANKVTGDDPHLFEVINNGTARQLLRISTYGDGSIGGQNNMHWVRMRGTLASPTATQAGDYFMSMGFRGYDGSTFLEQSAAAFQCYTPANWTATSHPTEFEFDVTDTGAVARSQAMRIFQNGAVSIGTNTVTPTAKSFVVNGGKVGIGTTAPRQNLSIGSTLDIYAGAANTPTTSSIRGNGNLFLNAYAGGGTYLNYDAGSGGVYFGDGASSVTGAWYSSGKVSIGSNSVPSDAILQLNSTTLGFRPSLMTTTQRNAIGSVSDGLMVANSTTHTIDWYNGSAWASLGSGSGTVTSVNAGTNLSITAGTNTVNPTLSIVATPTLSLTASTGLSLTTGVTGVLPIANGGTNATTANAALNNLLPSQSAPISGEVLVTNGTNTVYSPIAAAPGQIIFSNNLGMPGSASTLLYDGTNAQIGNAATTGLSIGTALPTTNTLNHLFVGGDFVAIGQNVAGGEMEFGLNYYYNSGFKYRFTSSGGNSPAARLVMNANSGRYGAIDFESAPGGTAGGAITWTTNMTLLTNGNLGIGNTTCAEKLDVTGNIKLSGAIKSSATQTTVNNSTSGTTIFSQPQQGSTYKIVLITCAAALGTASYTFPTAFTVTPSVVGTNDAATGIVTAISTTAVTITGATTTGSLMLIGY